VSHCDLCGEGIAAVPYKCAHCGKTLCPIHRLPESHQCAMTQPRAKAVRTPQVKR